MKRIKGISEEGIRRIARLAKESQSLDEITQGQSDMMSNKRIMALASFLDIDPSEVEQGYDETHLDADGGEFLVLTDQEAEEAFMESFRSYVAEVVLDQIPIELQQYFNVDAFARDVQMSDGRGSTLASYDGYEGDSGDFFIYRIG